MVEDRSDSPNGRMPATPKNNKHGKELSTPGSILQTLFSPARWFKDRPQAPMQEQQQLQDHSSGTSDSEMEEDDGAKQVDKTRDVWHEDTPRTPQNDADSSIPKSQSPNALLASFFSNRGDAPLSEIEREGVMAILTKQAVSTPTNPPSYATPLRKAYQPIFTPVKADSTTSRGTFTEARTERRFKRPNLLKPLTNASPFRHRTPRSSFTAQESGSTGKHDLSATIAPSEDTKEGGKRALEEVAAPAPKRTKMDTAEQQPVRTKTAASVLAILDASKEKTVTITPGPIRTMLNPYARNSLKRPSPSPRRSPARKSERNAIEEIARVDAIERKLPHQPTRSSNLSTSFTAEDSLSLFSPRRKIATPSQMSESSSEHNKARRTDLTTASVAKQMPAASMFPSSEPVHSLTPKFSFTASQISSTREPNSTIDRQSIDEAAAAAKRGTQSSIFAASTSQANGEPNPSTISNEQPAHKSSSDFSFTPIAPKTTFSFEPIKNTQAHGLTKKDSESSFSTPAFSFSAPESVVGRPTEEQSDKDSDIVVHQLRDGTEYVSPSKPRKPDQGGFVFTPTHTKSASTFTFGSVKELPASSSEMVPSGSFTFDSNKKVDIIGKSLGEVKSAPTTASKPQPDDRSRILAMSTDELQSYAFTICPMQSETEVRRKAAIASVTKYDFTVPQKQTFNWAAAGMAKPEQNGWTCEVCMVSNTDQAEKCVSCEAEKPRSKAINGTTTKSSFDWAAAGLSKPTGGWTCSTCMVSNPEAAQTCVSCEADR